MTLKELYELVDGDSAGVRCKVSELLTGDQNILVKEILINGNNTSTITVFANG